MFRYLTFSLRLIAYLGIGMAAIHHTTDSAMGETLRWIGAGTGSNDAIDPTELSTSWSQGSNWDNNPTRIVPQLDATGQGTTAEISFSNGGRVFVNELAAERVIVENQHASPSWLGQLVLGSNGVHRIGRELSLTSGAVLVQHGGELTMVAPDSNLRVAEGSIFRMEHGTFKSTGSALISGGSTLDIGAGYVSMDQISIADRNSLICSSDDGTLRVRRL